jgi:hypothetical protein
MKRLCFHAHSKYHQLLLIKLLLAFASTVIPGFSLHEFHNQDFVLS